MYRHMNHVHGINIHPGQGRQQVGARRRRQPRRAVGRRGPVATRPQATPFPPTPLSLQAPQAWQEPQAPQVVAEPYIILGWDDEEQQEDADFGTPAFGQVMGAEQAIPAPAHDQSIAEPYIILYRDIEQQEDAEFGINAFDRIMDAQQAFEVPTYDQIFDPTLSTTQLFCLDQNCLAVFNNQEHLLGHLHSTHGLPYSEDCECIECFLKKIAGEFVQVDGEGQYSGMAALLQTTTPVAGLETYAGGNDMDVDNDSGIDDNSPHIDQPLSHSNKPIDQPIAKHNDTPASNGPGSMASD